METLERLKAHAALIIANGGPVTAVDFEVMKIWREFSTIPRPRKDHGGKGKKARVRKAKA